MWNLDTKRKRHIQEEEKEKDKEAQSYLALSAVAEYNQNEGLRWLNHPNNSNFAGKKHRILPSIWVCESRFLWKSLKLVNPKPSQNPMSQWIQLNPSCLSSRSQTIVLDQLSYGAVEFCNFTFIGCLRASPHRTQVCEQGSNCGSPLCKTGNCKTNLSYKLSRTHNKIIKKVENASGIFMPPLLAPGDLSQFKPRDLKCPQQLE